MPLLDRSTLNTIQDRPNVDVDMSAFPGWEGVTVRLRAITGTQRAAIEREWLDLPEGTKLPDKYKERVLARCIVGEDGEPAFTVDDVTALSAKSGAAIDHIYATAAKMNGLDKKSVEDAAKN
jgi:hypothetical protein